MTGSLSQLETLTLSAGTAFVTAELLRSVPIYESLLIRILKRQGQEVPKESQGKC